MVTIEKELKTSTNISCAGNSCEIRDAFMMIGGKWKSMILYVLSSEGVVRFNQLKKKVSGISQKMLTQQLRELERDGLINRQIFLEVPPRVEYSMTQLGLSLGPIYEAVHNWKQENYKAVSKCRSQYDANLN
ncbi:helix-turn-helix domain-containing protein [Polynucleobacter sp. IMCC 30228]|uniref:winged helix-turn-helix transcriptional regulator n=1 Tax=Polynucleobacter sp. IMCC 30228 TaxID=2781011 RepID=UPI001F3D44C9|nr:helix-turn-helix domain-containing protein [Polynucleobacter sp. IMCC 30228]MCE7528229.1 helix-turn-helix transcriptional regulator [Polynucleobacter sp. IMCC 30228]